MSSHHHHHHQREGRSSRSDSFNTTDKPKERRSIETQDSRSTAFDVQVVFQSFSNALREPDSSQSSIGTQDYINGYRELLK